MIKYRVPILYEVDALAKQNNVDVYIAGETEEEIKDLIVRTKQLEDRIMGLEAKNETLKDLLQSRNMEIDRIREITYEILLFLTGSDKKEISIAQVNKWIKALEGE